MQGKTVLVTGATQGIGRITALDLARRGAKLSITARDRARGDAVVAEIKEKTGADVELWLCDFARLDDIRRFAGEFGAKHPKLDVLVNNAGAINMERKLTPDGMEMTFAVNHLGYFLLTGLLLDRLKAAAPSRIVNVASDAHSRGHIDFDDLMGEKRYAGFRAGPSPRRVGRRRQLAPPRGGGDGIRTQREELAVLRGEAGGAVLLDARGRGEDFDLPRHLPPGGRGERKVLRQVQGEAVQPRVV